MNSLIDTGFMFAVLDESDAVHQTCSSIFRRERGALIPEAVLPELAYLVIKNLGYRVQTDFMRYLADGNLTMVSTKPDDLRRALEILLIYQDIKLDYVDAVIMAIAERLNIRRILTVDRRDFGIFRPRHCDFFEIVP